MSCSAETAASALNTPSQTGPGCIRDSLSAAVLWEVIFNFLKDRKSVILGVWAAPGAPETSPLGGKRRDRGCNEGDRSPMGGNLRVRGQSPIGANRKPNRAKKDPQKTKQIHHQSTKTTPKLPLNHPPGILCYAIVLPGRMSAFRAGFWPDCYRESTEIGPSAGRRPAGGPISMLSR